MFANTVDPDETPHNEPTHQDINCLPFSFLLLLFLFLNDNLICKYGYVYIQIRKSTSENQG